MVTFSHHTLDLPENANILPLSRLSSGLFSIYWSYPYCTHLNNDLTEHLLDSDIHLEISSAFTCTPFRSTSLILTFSFLPQKINHSVSFHGFHDQAFPGPHICPYWPFHSHLTYPSLLSAHELQWFSVSSLSSTHPRHFSLLADFSTSFSLLQSLSFIYGKSHRCN